ncbi:MAG TPA: tyrosine protein kinase [Algoriphagus sp.]|jgi:capsular exopolysaccharide synthesis family protein|uniref:GumC family protein n=2 Tax=Algoriphagus TaxID=246875 RepID=UPI000C56181D|nr:MULTISPECIES: polysaccharide biosynthesis tyrosine autokinase [unclassified Algoriphagus]MAL14380.1 tyrosine protein kinase [Algoriphagus sp.]HAD50579.1 tyrosine protein kinase [Algoriphagus sp.]HAH38890.1 tyrosine protein kinase [Algoriphagus sp.]HCD87037.1 tyrosine protein kinase [Algoriphagus sp.]|tara:strand:+ start:31 stop:2490 length:2460 start_codon:yes stop_codon:yes gene_type:complete
MEKLDLSQLDNEEKALEIRYVVAKYIRYWPWYVLFTMIFLIATFLFHRYTVDEYEVTGSMVIKTNTSPEARIMDRSNIFNSGVNLENDILRLRSKNLAREALKKLHFDVEYFAKTNIKDIELYDRSPIRVDVDWGHLQVTDTQVELQILSDENFKLLPYTESILDINSAQASGDESIYNKTYTFGQEVETGRSKFTVHLVNPGRVGDIVIFQLKNPSYLEEYWARAIRVNLENDFSSVLRITTTTKVVEKGRDYINSLMESYINYDLNEKNKIQENTIAFIEEQLGFLEDSLKQKERELQEFKVENKLLDVSAEFSNILTKMNTLDEKSAELDYQLNYFEQIRRYMEMKSKDFSDVIAPSVIGVPDPLLNGLIQTLVTLSQDRRKLLATVNENHPEVVKIDVQMEKVQDALFENVVNLIENTQKQKQSITREIRSYDAQFATLPESESKYTGIFREFKLRESLYTYLLEKRAEAGIARASNVSDNAILDAAKRGTLVFPKKQQNYALAIALGLLLPFGFIVVRDMFDDTIKDQRDLKKHFMIPQLGVIGYSQKETNKVVLEHPKSAVAESFRSLRSAITYLASGKNTKRILVTSSVSGEGKTFTSLNLASAMALGSKRTVVVGGDLRRPKLAQYFNQSDKVGLSTYLIGKVEAPEIVMKSDNENLYFVPSGVIPPNPAELLQTQRLKDFLDYLDQNFDVIIFDTPPMGLVSETIDLMRLFDINLYVVRQNYTNKDHLVMINDLFNNKQVKNVYGVFNGIINSGYHYEGYNYGYGNTYLYSQNNKYMYNYYGDDLEAKKKKIKLSKKPWFNKVKKLFKTR